MYYIEQIGCILADMLKNKLRVVLTMIGIIVGVCSVIIIISVGMTTTQIVDLYFAGSLGDNRITAYVYSKSGANDFSASYNEINEFANNSYVFYGALFETEQAVAGTVSVDDRHHSSVNLKGVSASFQKARQLVMLNGRFLNEADSLNKSSSAVISEITAEYCFGTAENSLGKSITVNGKNGETIDLVVVGVYKVIDNTGKLSRMDDKSLWVSDIYCTYDYYNKCMNINTDEYKTNNFTLVINDNVDLPAAFAEANAFLAARNSSEDYVYNCYEGFSLSSSTNATVQLITLVFIAAAVLSLVVGGISLMNTMLVNVKERTKEIGTRKALGASNTEIVGQFILESVVICVIACMIGIILSYIIIFIIQQNLTAIFNRVTDDTLVYFLTTSDITIKINGLSIAVSALFSAAVGVTFGAYPARKAAKMPVTDALRYE